MAQLLSPEQEAFRDLQEPCLLIFLPGTLPVSSREPLVRFRCLHLLGDRISLFPRWACPPPSSLCSSLCAAQSAHPLCPRSRTPFSSRLSGLECVACGTMGGKICRMEEKLNSGPFCSFGEFGTHSSETLPATFTCVSSLKASEKV